MAHPQSLQCPFNEYVDCTPVHDCTKCGWNPEVQAERSAKMGFIKNTEKAEEEKQ